MKKIKASIKDQTLTIEQSVINVAGSVNAYALEIAYDAEWDEMDTKIVTFTHGPIRLGIQDDGSEDGVVIPHEVLTFPGVVTVGVVGYKDSEAKLTTTGLYKRNTFVVLPQALGLADALTPTPDIYVKLVNKLEELQGDYDNLSDEMGSLSDLETQNKDNLVAAINEVLNSGGGSGTVKSVNHKDPDADGNVALAYTDIPGRPSLATVATTGNYNDLTNKPTIPTVNNATLTIQKNGTDVATFTANSATNQTANIAVPTTASDIGAEPTIDSEHKLASDLVDDTDQTNKFATADDLSKLGGIESGAEVNDIDSISVNGTAVTPDEHKNVDITVPTYTAGTNVQISSGNVISATDTTYSNFTGTDGQTAGAAGLVPAPATTDVGKFLKADGTWDTAGSVIAVIDNLTSTSTTDALSANQGRVLNGKIEARVITGNGAPTTATVGNIGTLYEDTTNGKLYQCTAIDTTDPDNPSYTWDEVGGSGVTPVQTTGTSTTDVMSQDAATKLVFPDIANASAGQIRIDPSGTSSSTGTRGIAIGKKVELTYTSSTPIGIGFNTKAANGSISIGSSINGLGSDAVAIGSGSGNILANAVRIGSSTRAVNQNCVAVGYNANAGESTNQIAIGAQSDAGSFSYSVAIGSNSSANGNGAVAIGAYSSNAHNGTVHVGTTNTSYGYSNTNYRKITGVYPGENEHDAATVAQGNTLATTAPTTATAGVLGQLYTDTTNMHTYQCTAIDTTDPNNPAYTWTQRW